MEYDLLLSIDYFRYSSPIRYLRIDESVLDESNKYIISEIKLDIKRVKLQTGKKIFWIIS